ncbi:MAG: carbon monoxide dehydrogenase [Synechococcaceae cyanobacterium SM2_3_1]|nr:carbon monoxide dehydrogenase [Synechococcaceae cyanobacterium SM2_3_1]
MDLHTVQHYLRPDQFSEIQKWPQGYAYLAGGTWLFSQPQPQVHTLVDLEGLGWSGIEVTQALEIGATCSLQTLLCHPWPREWSALYGLQQAIASLASFKVTHLATVGGNLCLALPFGIVAPGMLVLEAAYELADLNGIQRLISARSFQTGPLQTQLQPGEVLRRIHIPLASLEWESRFDRIGVTASDPALAMLVTACAPDRTRWRFGLNAGVSLPLLLQYDHQPDPEAMLADLERITDWVEDYRASARYRRHLTWIMMQRATQSLASLR